MYDELYLTCIFHHVWKKDFKFMMFTFLENVMNLGIFTRAPIPHSKLKTEFFENQFFPKQKEVEKTMICFIKIQSENIKMTWKASLFIFCMICNFSKCDGFTVL